MSEADTSPNELPRRVMSIDALRGFDMFWIMGGRETVLGIAALVAGGTVPAWLDYHLEHPEWIGFSGWDLIMPLFLFLVGAVQPFSLGMQREAGVPLGRIYRRMARRVLLLWIFGMFAQGNLIRSVVEMDLTDLHFFSNTLQAIAAGYVIAGIAVLHLSLRGQITLCGALLLLYWLLLAFVPVPGHGVGMLEPHANLALYVDEVILGPFRDGTTYTWILSSLGFGATVLLGVFAGEVLKRPSPDVRKLGMLAGIGAALLAAGWLWDQFFPIIKHIWTSSMVLWAGGWSFLLLALFFYIVDMRGWRRAAFPFVVIGANAILAYMVGEMWVHEWNELFGQDAGVVWRGAVSFAALITFTLILYVLYRKRIFLRV